MTKIMLFDSGAGGLSVANEIISALKSADMLPATIHYLADDAYFPYGELSEALVLERVHKCILTQVSRVSPDILVVACNTASTIVLPELRRHLSIPVVGVVPAIKPASKVSKNAHIGLLATPATINRPYTDELIQQFAAGTTVSKVGSTELVEMAESAILGESVSLEKMAEILSPFSERVDVIVLGCTHFPLLKKQIKDIVGDSVQLVDSGEAIARRVLDLLGVEDKTSFVDGNKFNIDFSLSYTKKGIPSEVWMTKVKAVIPDWVKIDVQVVIDLEA